jgi:hypothetical protein
MECSTRTVVLRLIFRYQIQLNFIVRRQVFISLYITANNFAVCSQTMSIVYVFRSILESPVFIFLNTIEPSRVISIPGSFLEVGANFHVLFIHVSLTCKMNKPTLLSELLGLWIVSIVRNSRRYHIF